MPRWKLNGWKTKSGNEVKNKEMFEKLDQCINSMDSVSWVNTLYYILVSNLDLNFILESCTWPCWNYW